VHFTRSNYDAGAAQAVAAEIIAGAFINDIANVRR
jgi:hypothetical protein